MAIQNPTITPIVPPATDTAAIDAAVAKKNAAADQANLTTYAGVQSGVKNNEYRADGSTLVTYNDGSTSIIPGGSTTNPVVSSTGTRNDITAIGNDVNKLTAGSTAATKLLQDRMDALEARRESEIASIKSSYEEAAATQAERQGQDYAGRSTGLVTSGGGFLGTTQSQQGVLQKLKGTFEDEKSALIAKRDAAIREAENAYDDKQFALAQAKINEVKDLENELYSRQKDSADQQLAVARENRAQAEYDRGYTDEKLKAYTALPDEEFAKLTPSKINEIDKFYYPGYTVEARKLNLEAAAGKSVEDDIKLRSSLQTLINKTPAGQKFTIGDKTYVGLKKAATGSGSAAGKISTPVATQLGVPSLAGQDESDVILSLSLAKPPQWYKDYYKSSNPEAYGRLSQEQLATDWQAFTNLPDIQAYKNSSVVSSRIAKASGGVLNNISADDIASALDEQ